MLSLGLPIVLFPLPFAKSLPFLSFARLESGVIGLREIEVGCGGKGSSVY